MKEQMNQLRLRPYRRDDALTIVNWCETEEAFYKWSAGILGEYPISVERLTNATSGRDDNDKYFPFVALDEDGVVGFFILRQPGDDRDELRFGFVIVDPNHRGEGYGKRMLQLGLKYAFEIYGAKKVSLGVFENNPGAFYCYKAIGFTENGQVENYNILNDDWKCIDMEISSDFC